VYLLRVLENLCGDYICRGLRIILSKKSWIIVIKKVQFLIINNPSISDKLVLAEFYKTSEPRQ
jgi:hypothetical protein